MDDWKDIEEPKGAVGTVTAAQVATGPVIPPQTRLLTYSAQEWEGFVEEWAHYCLKKLYKNVRRFTGAGDRGIDVAGFVDGQFLKGVWDNYQCKHYDNALAPTDVWAEIGKIVWHSFQGDYTAPRRYYFVAPKGTGTKLTKLLSDTTELREGLIENWEKYVKKGVTGTQQVELDDALRAFVDKFDFSIFEARTGLQLVEDHKATPVHVARFGGGLRARPAAGKPPAAVAPGESRYVTQLLGAYSEHTGTAVSDSSAISPRKLNDHFVRQREAFYAAESLRVFARDSVPPGTFESLQDNIYDSVIDTHDGTHADGYHKVCAVTKAAQEVQITANALITCTDSKDRHGICHQLVNDERMWWKK